MRSAPPASLTWATRSLAAICALGALATVLIVVLRDDLIRSWAEGRRDIRRILETQGLEAVKDGAVHPPAFVPVAVAWPVPVAWPLWPLPLPLVVPLGLVGAALRAMVGWVPLHALRPKAGRARLPCSCWFGPLAPVRRVCAAPCSIRR